MQTVDDQNITVKETSESSKKPKSDVEPKTNDETKICLSMISSLSEDEKEKAARTSYRYFVASTSKESKPSKEEKDKYAMAMARRHLRAENGNEEKALKKMRNTIEYREEKKVDVIRRCFYDREADFSPDDKYQHHLDNLSRELMDGKLFVRGYSKDGRALYVVLTHMFEKSGFDHDWYMRYNIYTLERALACTERASNGKLEKIVCAFDFGQYSNAVRMPVSLSKEITYCLRDHYPERVEKILLIDAPFIFRAFYNLVYPFIDADTRKKILFVKGNAEKTEKVGNIISTDQSMPFMQPGGEMKSDLDMKAFLYDTPFDKTYEECQ